MRLAADEHLLFVCVHHIASDGWSMALMVREFVSLYESNRGGRSSELKDMRIQYADFAVWQRRWMEAGELDRQMSYWKERLKGIAMLELPTDRARPAVASHRGASEQFRLGGELTEGLKQMSRREGVTLYMSMLGGLAVVLSRYSGQQDIAVGTAIAGRNRAETEGLIGFFVNTLVMRTEVRGEQSVRELMRGVREEALGAYANQDVPFERVVEEMQPERSLSHQALFQVMLVMQKGGGEQGHWEG